LIRDCVRPCFHWNY